MYKFSEVLKQEEKKKEQEDDRWDREEIDQQPYQHSDNWFTEIEKFFCSL